MPIMPCHQCGNKLGPDLGSLIQFSHRTQGKVIYCDSCLLSISNFHMATKFGIAFENFDGNNTDHTDAMDNLREVLRTIVPGEDD